MSLGELRWYDRHPYFYEYRIITSKHKHTDLQLCHPFEHQLRRLNADTRPSHHILYSTKFIWM